jgi:hypothetical protein
METRTGARAATPRGGDHTNSFTFGSKVLGSSNRFSRVLMMEVTKTDSLGSIEAT